MVILDELVPSIAIYDEVSLIKLAIKNIESESYGKNSAIAGLGEKKSVKHRKQEGVGKGHAVRRCKLCGKQGHIAKTCPDKEPTNASEAIDAMRAVKITGTKLMQIKSLLQSETPMIHIESETGVPVERIEKIKEQLGL